MLLFATNKRSHDWNKSRDLRFQFTIYRGLLFEIWTNEFSCISSKSAWSFVFTKHFFFLNTKAQNLLWNIQRLKDPIQSLWNNRRHFAERDTIMAKALWIEISNFRYRIVASRSTCCYSGNPKFCFLKSRLVTCRIIVFRDKTFCFSR